MFMYTERIEDKTVVGKKGVGATLVSPPAPPAPRSDSGRQLGAPSHRPTGLDNTRVEKALHMSHCICNLPASTQSLLAPAACFSTTLCLYNKDGFTSSAAAFPSHVK
ncbi:hypothetical protein JYU34_017008 [Plutella xylostella]|uniref:Uncharacterized protein n=1 Tax=Plutella xylostella TaxID=51655 RepID=A0ABQ7Q5I2_PLUXY|nr:hypothetical protein JYU34_017008 [Plutella xylostella]